MKLGNLFKAAVEMAILPISVTRDAIMAIPESAEGKTPFKTTCKNIEAIVDDLNEFAEQPINILISITQNVIRKRKIHIRSKDSKKMVLRP